MRTTYVILAGTNVRERCHACVLLLASSRGGHCDNKDKSHLLLADKGGNAFRVKSQSLLPAVQVYVCPTCWLFGTTYPTSVGDREQHACGPQLRWPNDGRTCLLPHCQSRRINERGSLRPSGLMTMQARMKAYGVGSAPSRRHAFGTSRPWERTQGFVSSAYAGSAVNNEYAKTPQLQLSHVKP